MTHAHRDPQFTPTRETPAPAQNNPNARMTSKGTA